MRGIIVPAAITGTVITAGTIIVETVTLSALRDGKRNEKKQVW
jgi:hypothetical protein